MNKFHQPVLTDEVINYLQPKSGDDFIDCTLGGGGHAVEILKKTAPAGRLLGIDLDPAAIEQAQAATAKFASRVKLVLGNYKLIQIFAAENGFDQVAGILLDLGLSSGQLDDAKRGFSFSGSGRLDMRFNPEAEVKAADILMTYRLEQLSALFKKYGEERLAGPIAAEIVKRRKTEMIETADQLANLVTEVYQRYFHGQSKTHPATKVFQALRMKVNDEPGNLTAVLPQAVKLLKPGGRLAVISFHSLEDRAVKEYFKQESRGCICPPERPTCQCRHVKALKIITKKPIAATFAELAINPRARSAKLRVAEKIQ